MPYRRPPLPPDTGVSPGATLARSSSALPGPGPAPWPWPCALALRPGPAPWPCALALRPAPCALALRPGPAPWPCALALGGTIVPGRKIVSTPGPNRADTRGAGMTRTGGYPCSATSPARCPWPSALSPSVFCWPSR